MNVANDARDFFKRGDDGTYGGGPADMLPDDFADLELDSVAPLSPSQRQRRARLTRLVATIVVVLGFGSSMVFAQHALSEDTPSKGAATLVADGPHAKSSRVAAAPVVTVQDLPLDAHSPPAVAPAPAKSTEQKPLPSTAAPVVALEDLPLEAHSPPAVAPAPAVARALARSTKRKSTKRRPRASKRKPRANAKASVKGNWDKLPPAP